MKTVKGFSGVASLFTALTFCVAAWVWYCKGDVPRATFWAVMYLANAAAFRWETLKQNWGSR